MELVAIEGALRVGVTHRDGPSDNAKIGPRMAQIWIEGAGACGGCPLRPAREGGEGGCYVRPYVVTRALRDTLRARVEISPAELAADLAARGRSLRISAHGDASEAPRTAIALAEAAEAAGVRVIGYSHGWRKAEAQPLRRWLMASVHTAEEAAEARAMGWRPAIATDDPAEARGAGARQCPATREGSEVQCDVCHACDGTARRGSDAGGIWFPLHGAQRARAARAIEALALA